jgi:tetratricopeptide (TPR) repeat protein
MVKMDMKINKKHLKEGGSFKGRPKIISTILAASFAANFSFAQDSKYPGFANNLSAAPELSAKQESTPTSQLVKQGLVYLKERNFENAQKVFGAAAKLSPSSSTIHILNGLGYHLDFLKGVPDSKSLAETAYEVAYSMDQKDPLAIIQLGRLHIDSGEYTKASKDYVRAISIAPKNIDALYGLLQSSLLQQDVKTALWAAEMLKDAPDKTPDHLKLIAITYSLVGQDEEAQRQFDSYVKLTGANGSSVDYVKSMLSHIAEQNKKWGANGVSGGQFYKAGLVGGEIGGPNIGDRGGPGPRSSNGPGPRSSNGPESRFNDGVSPAAVAAAKNNQNLGPNPGDQNSKASSAAKKSAKANLVKGAAGAGQTNDSTTTDSSSDDSASVASGSSSPYSPAMGGSGGGGMGGGGMGGGSGGGGVYSASAQGNQKRKWFDCDVKPGLGKAPGGSYGVPVGGTSGDQTLYLEPLPAPCDNRNPPKMAMIDAVLIRTVDAQSTSNGVNLLNGLQIFAGAQRTTTTGYSPTNASVIGVGLTNSATLNGVSGLISYSMNIANSVSSSAQVVARPTLTAVDRVPSTFYNGQVQTIGLNGGGVSGAQVTNVPTGTSLSITPTFVDEETMMLAVKVSRSFVSNASPIGGFTAGLSTQNHAVTANVRIRYGETLVLDGLTDREYDKTQNGVPILQDIPIIQYLFSNLTKSAISENVIVLVTPRRVVANEADLERIQVEMMKSGSKINVKEFGVYEQIKGYEKLQNFTSNTDVAIKALEQDSAFYRDLKNHILLTNDWVAESGFKRFLNSVANTIYFH